MLDFMRRHAQSWMIKAALGAVVVVFIFWGIWTPHESRGRDLARIGDYTITVAEARSHYQNLLETYRSIYRERFTEEMARQLGLKERAVKDLVDKVLLLQEANRLGLKVSASELKSAIQNYPAFQKDGAFDQATYLGALQRARLGVKDFEAQQSQMLLLSKVQSLITSSAQVSEQEVLEFYRSTFEKINLQMMVVDPDRVKDVPVGPEQSKEYFSKHREDFKLPARVKARYLRFDPKDYAQKVQVSPQEVESYYENNREKFGQPKQVKVRHILIRADGKDKEALEVARKKAEGVRQEAAQGKDFANLAKRYSEDPGTKDGGGELGFIQRGQVVPEFEEAAFSLPAGGISQVIQTPYGLHILRVDEVREARLEPLEKVRSQVKSILQTRKAQELAHDAADQAYAAGSKGKALEEFARENNLTMKETGTFSAADQTDLDPKLRDSALALGKGESSPVMRLGDSFAVLQVVEKEEARLPEFQEVEQKVAGALRRQNQMEKALARSGEILEKLKKGGEISSLAKQEGLALEETGFFERGAGPPKIEFSKELVAALSPLGLKSPYPEKPVLAGGKFYIFRLKERKNIDQGEFKKQKENYRLALLQQKQELVLRQWLDQLLEQAKAKGQFQMLQEANEAI